MSLSVWADIATIAASLAAVAGLVAIWLQLKTQNQQRQLELGNFYINRYWQLDDDMLLTDKREVDHRRHRHRYLRLTEDEYDAASFGWLDEEQWRVWHAVFVTERGASALRADLEAVAVDSGFESIRACLMQREAAAEGHQAKECAARLLPRPK